MLRVVRGIEDRSTESGQPFRVFCTHHINHLGGAPTKKDGGAIFSGPFSTETTWLCLLGQAASLLSVVGDRWLCRTSPSGHFDTWYSKRDHSGHAGADIYLRSSRRC